MRVATRGRQHTILHRPLPLLYPLEVFGEMVQQEAPPGASSEQGQDMPHNDLDGVPDEPEHDTHHDGSNGAPDRQYSPSLGGVERRPQRAAAKKANELRSDWIQELVDD